MLVYYYTRVYHLPLHYIGFYYFGFELQLYCDISFITIVWFYSIVCRFIA